MADERPHIAHVVHRFDVGGLENGIVNLINAMPYERCRHSIICLTGYNLGFFGRLRKRGVGLYALGKREGQDWALYWRLFRLLLSIRPDIVHTRNIATLEAQLPAWLAGVKGRVHGEHGWDMKELGEARARYRRLRRLTRPFVKHYIALSPESRDYLRDEVSVAEAELTQIVNGVDVARFSPRARPAVPALDVLPPAWRQQAGVVLGTVGRLSEVKNQALLVRAVARLCQHRQAYRRRLRVIIVGDGPSRPELEALIESLGVTEQIWLTGARDDVADLMRAMDVFALPSRAEGVSNTVLEAMACGLPVVATDVGANGSLIEAGRSGELVPSDDEAALATTLDAYLRDARRRRAEGGHARQRAEQFSLARMAERYWAVYRRVLAIAPEGTEMSDGENREPNYE